MSIGAGDFLEIKIPPPRGLGYSLFQREIKKPKKAKMRDLLRHKLLFEPI